MLPISLARQAEPCWRSVSRWSLKPVGTIRQQGAQAPSPLVVMAAESTSAGRSSRSLAFALPPASWADAPSDRSGRARVEAASPSRPGRPDILVVGDAAAAAGPSGGEAPDLAAPPADGGHVGLTILARLSGDGDARPFRYRDYGSLATIGRNAAIVRVGALRLTGFPGWLVLRAPFTSTS